MTYVGSPTLGSTALKALAGDKSVSFNGTSQYATIGHNAALKPTAAVSIEAIIKPNISTGQTNRAILCCWQTGGYGIAIDYNSATLVTVHFQLYKASAWRAATTTIPVGKATVVTGTFDGRYVRIYKNGVIANTLDTGSSGVISYSANNSLLIGANPNASTGVDANTYFPGNICHVSLYGSALSAARVAARYAETLGIIAGTIANSNSSDLFSIVVMNPDDGTKYASITQPAGPYNLEVDVKTPLLLLVFPVQGREWSSGLTVAANDLIFPTDLEALPYYFKAVTAGVTDTSEPAWVVGSLDDNTVTWEAVGRIRQPIAQYPTIPQ
jgi:hypothetical protein